jgi:hypothetical protein
LGTHVPAVGGEAGDGAKTHLGEGYMCRCTIIMLKSCTKNVQTSKPLKANIFLETAMAAFSCSATAFVN